MPDINLSPSRLLAHPLAAGWRRRSWLACIHDGYRPERGLVAWSASAGPASKPACGCRFARSAIRRVSERARPVTGRQAPSLGGTAHDGHRRLDQWLARVLFVSPALAHQDSVSGCRSNWRHWWHTLARDALGLLGGLHAPCSARSNAHFRPHGRIRRHEAICEES